MVHYFTEHHHERQPHVIDLHNRVILKCFPHGTNEVEIMLW